MLTKEDYCSFEISKLLKEKGFDEVCDHYIDCHWEEDGVLLHTPCKTSDLMFGYMCPTHQMAMKWLREVHNIIIAIRPPYNWNGKNPTNYLFDVWHYCDDNTDINISVVSSTIYKEAVEAALKYCLTKLI